MSKSKKAPTKQRASKGVVEKLKDEDGNKIFRFVDRPRFDDVTVDVPIEAEDDYETAMFEGGSRIKILIASSNVGNAPVLELDSWLPRGAPHTDIVVFGLQESTYKATVSKEETAAIVDSELDVDLQDSQDPVTKKDTKDAAANAAANAAAAVEEEDDEEDDEDEAPKVQSSEEKLSGSRHLLLAIQRHLGDEFVLLERVMRGQMRIRVYIRKSLAPKVSNIEIGAENTGLAHVYANKGGQGVKFDLAGTTIVLINSHLAAHETAAKCNKRNSNVREIFGGLRFGNKLYDVTQFDHVLWFGDLNYRIEPPATLSRPDQMKMVKDLIEKDDYEALWQMDELQREVKQGRAFANFNTAKPLFKPTFKVERAVATNYNPKRLPSYCDRVLWKSLKHLKSNLKCHAFTGCHAFATSDHKPIIARFGITPTPKVTLCDWPSFNGAGFDHFPQLKFYDLRAKDLEAMDEGLTFQQKETKQIEQKQQDGNNVETATSGGGGAAEASSQPQKKGAWTLGTAKSDPYCVIHTFPPQLRAAASDVKTETVMQALSPVWETEPLLSLKVANADPLKDASFSLSVIDYDALNADDVIGSADFTFEEVLSGQNKDGIFIFQRDCVFKGNIRGTICGKIEVNIPHFDGSFPHKSRCIEDKGLTLVAKPASCCSIS